MARLLDVFSDVEGRLSLLAELHELSKTHMFLERSCYHSKKHSDRQESHAKKKQGNWAVRSLPVKRWEEEVEEKEVGEGGGGGGMLLWGLTWTQLIWR